jgi:hypothetical protein
MLSQSGNSETATKNASDTTRLPQRQTRRGRCEALSVVIRSMALIRLRRVRQTVMLFSAKWMRSDADVRSRPVFVVPANRGARECAATKVARPSSTRTARKHSRC